MAGFVEGFPTFVGVNLEFTSRFLCFCPSRCSLYVLKVIISYNNTNNITSVYNRFNNILN